ncbi:GroES-like protein [Mycena venus]|uniref:GroES-like protein n=1 Tax=Mycena venus TaxID=2733690 RepID=A0A8H6YYG9_9AGAR|nr:GroES-like protein [Mycena venus]
MATQQALIIPSPKAPFTLVSDQPIPVPGPGEVRLKVLSVGLNPMDWGRREYNMLMGAYPSVIGSDIAGVVEEVGEGVQEFAEGDEVFVGSMEGGFQQYCVVPAATVIRKPKNITFDQAASFPITCPTAAVGLFAQGPIGLALNPSFSWDKPQQGQSGLVIGAGTSTGQFDAPAAVQFLKFLGFTRIVAYASKAHFSYLKELGATECIDRGDVPLEALSAAVSSKVNVAYDATPVGALDAAYDSVLDGGKVTTVRPQAVLSGDRDPQKRGITVVNCFGFYAGPEIVKPLGDPAHWAATVEHTKFGKHFIRELPKAIEKGAIVPNRVEILQKGLAGIPDALERMKTGSVSGVKLVAHPQDSIA